MAQDGTQVEGGLPDKFLLDLRDMKVQIKDEVQFCRKTKYRPTKTNVDILSVELVKGTRIGDWSGKKSGKCMGTEIVSLEVEKGIFEGEYDIGCVNIGIVNRVNQVGIETSAAGMRVQGRCGPAKVQATALSAGCEAGIGRNTGAFVRASAGSVGGSCGPIRGTLALSFDTGARLGKDGIEVRALGNGVMVDKHKGIEVAAFGTAVAVKPWKTTDDQVTEEPVTVSYSDLLRKESQLYE